MLNRACRSSMKPLPPIARCASSKRLRIVCRFALVACSLTQCTRDAAVSTTDTTISRLANHEQGLAIPSARERIALGRNQSGRVDVGRKFAKASVWQHRGNMFVSAFGKMRCEPESRMC